MPARREGVADSGCGPVPEDVRRAVLLLRQSLRSPCTTATLAARCGVAERTLSEHFRAFLGLSPSKYLRRLRLTAAREALLTGTPDISVTKVAGRYLFNHQGRFAQAYRRHFGELPSTTLRRAQSGRRRDAVSEATDAPANEPSASSNDRGFALRPTGLGSRTRPSIAVLLGSGGGYQSQHTLFLEATAEAIASALGSLGSLAVMLPTSRGTALRQPEAAARDLGARYFLAGSLLPSQNRTRLILRLAETATGQHVWGDTIDSARDAPLQLMDKAIACVVQAVPAQIRDGEIRRVQAVPPRCLDAYGLTTRAMPYLFSSQADGARRALALLHAALDIDPDYGLASALAAWGYGQLVMLSGTDMPDDARQQAEKLSRRAAILEDRDPLALTALGAVQIMSQNFDAAEAFVARALAIEPTCGWAWGRRGWLHAYRGEASSAIGHFRRAISLSPRSARANLYAGIGSAHFGAGRYPHAVSWLRKAIVEQPGTVWANRSLSVAYARTGERRAAQEALDNLRRYRPGVTVSEVVAAVPFTASFLDRLGDGLSALGLPA